MNNNKNHALTTVFALGNLFFMRLSFSLLAIADHRNGFSCVPRSYRQGESKLDTEGEHGSEEG